MYCYIGSSGPGQSSVPNSPGYGKVTVEESKSGIIVAKLRADGAIEPAGMVATDSHVGWLTQHPTNGHLYCVAGANLLGMKIEADGSLSAPFTSADTAGGSAYLDITADGKWALSASYGDSLLSILPIADDGTAGAPTDVLKHEVPLNPALADRQEACHPHQVRVDLTQQWALVPDLGASRVWIYGLPTNAEGKFVRDQTSDAHLILPEGAGPRHLDFHPNGKWVYVLCELDGNVVLCDWDTDAGTLSPRQSIYALPDGVVCSRAHHSGCSHIMVSPNGANVYAATRTGPSLSLCLSVSHSLALSPSHSLTLCLYQTARSPPSQSTPTTAHSHDSARTSRVGACALATSSLICRAARPAFASATRTRRILLPTYGRPPALLSLGVCVRVCDSLFLSLCVTLCV
jgi:6-phosphogluconolactonase (cycloisomerase 2 family)